jgi:hypothetical protein
MLESCVIVKVTEVPVPEAGTFPVPVQPVHIYCVPADDPATIGVTEAVIPVPGVYDRARELILCRECPEPRQKEKEKFSKNLEFPEHSPKNGSSNSDLKSFVRLT